MWHDSVKPKLEEFAQKGFKIIIFTNQAGVESGKVTISDLQKKFKLIQEYLGIPIIFLAATQSDKFRKPAVGMWELLKDRIFKGSKIDMGESFYCGDAAGRPATATRKKDFTDTDIKFAANVGLKFYTPEQFFLGEKDAAVQKLDQFFKKAAATSVSDQKPAKEQSYTSST